MADASSFLWTDFFPVSNRIPPFLIRPLKTKTALEYSTAVLGAAKGQKNRRSSKWRPFYGCFQF
jgi:hypothetical protein